MQTFKCAVCEQPVFFENVQCTRCGALLAFLPERLAIVTLEPRPPHGFLARLPNGEELAVKSCRNNVDHAVCSWAMLERDESAFCRACRLNVTIPDLGQPEAKQAWAKLEQAKRRLLYTLLDIGLPIDAHDQPDGGLGFSFLASTPEEQVFTGQSNGLITINIAEADAPFREKIRTQLAEPYRTLLGHFRHEIGHYYWDRLVRDKPVLDAYRREFGDERADYQAAMEHHYRAGPPRDWALKFVSAYATMHPWEDWAETWAHYLHITDTLDTAHGFSLVVGRPSADVDGGEVATADLDFDSFDSVITAWVPLTIALNSLNRSMGLPDLYPFVLSDLVLRKLRFVHDLIQATRTKAANPAAVST